MSRPFAYRGKEKTCLWCGRPLVEQYEPIPNVDEMIREWERQADADPELTLNFPLVNHEDLHKYHFRKSQRWYRIKDLTERAIRLSGRFGYEGGGFFCRHACMKQWAQAMATQGHRLISKGES